MYSPVRSSLLRTLEAGEYFAENGNKPKTVDKVLFVMATSKPLKDLKEYNPPDFWTRLTHAIEIKHPLAIDDDKEEEKLKIIRNFFNHFWWMRIVDFYGMKPTFTSPPEEILLIPDKLIVFWQVHSMTQVMGFECKDRKDTNLVPIDWRNNHDHPHHPHIFAKTFYYCLNRGSSTNKNRDKQAFSIRGIRSMVTQLFSIGTSAVIRGMYPFQEHCPCTDRICYQKGDMDLTPKNCPLSRLIAKVFEEVNQIACFKQ